MLLHLELSSFPLPKKPWVVSVETLTQNMSPHQGQHRGHFTQSQEPHCCFQAALASVSPQGPVLLAAQGEELPARTNSWHDAAEPGGSTTSAGETRAVTAGYSCLP